MKKILVLANSSKGVYGFRNEFILKMLEEYEVYVSVPDDVCTKELEEEGCNILQTPINRRGMNPVEDFKLLLCYRKLLKEIKPDVVLTYTIKPNIYGGFACRIGGVPYMATITGLGSAMEGDGVLQKLTTFLYKVSMKKADCIFFQNDMNMQIFQKRNIKGKKQKRVSGSGVDLDRFPYMDMPDGDVIRFVFVSRIMKEKGIEQYLEAAKQIRDKYSNTEFWILGNCDEEYKEQLAKLHEEKKVSYFGMQKDVPKYLKDVHCLVHPSFYPEGMSNVCLEAAACGRAIITTKRTGCRETVDDGISGYLVEEKNASQLEEAMECFLRLTKEECIQMGRRGRQKVESEFDRKKVTQSYMEEIHLLLKDK